MRKPSLAATAALCFALVAPALAATEIRSPESVLGFHVGEDRKLADWDQIVDYFEKLGAASRRVQVEDVGRTTEGRPFLVVTISSEANMARLDEIRRVNARLADPRGLGDAEAADLVAKGKTIVAMNFGIHSTEVGAPQTSMQLAYLLATTEDPDLLDVLDQTVLLMIPCHNPDGTQKVVDWYRKSLGTPWEGGRIPFLYQKYVGHDDNRDWYMFTQVESRLTVRFLYQRWHPQIVHDLHQMGSRGARIFLPPYLDPYEPNVDPALTAAINDLGSAVAARLIAEGRSGVLIHGIYDAWTPARAYPHTHGGVRILSECASARMASPLTVSFDELTGRAGYDPKLRSWNFPRPWPGGTWRLRDIVDDQMAASRAILEHAARNRDFWLRNFLEVGRRAVARTDPFAFVVPAGQRDPLATARLLEVLRTGEVEVERARQPFQAAGRSFAEGSHVILMAQPYSAFAKSLLERQHYPDLRVYPGGPPRRPYDVTAHTLPLLMGVDVVTVRQPFEADLEPVAEVTVAPGRLSGEGASFAIGHETGALFALDRLLERGAAVRWALTPFEDAGRHFPAGTLLVPREARGVLEPLAEELGLDAVGVNAEPPALRLRRPRVGLYQSWVPSIDEGWTRFIFDQEAHLGYQTLHDADIRGGGLADRFDVILLPDQTRSQIVNGNAPETLPDRYVGGLGEAGVRALGDFVKAGGTLIALNAATELPLHDFELPVKNALARENPKDPTSLYCPGAILQVSVDPSDPLGHGLGDRSIVWFEQSPAFELTGGRAVERYTEPDPLLSGWLLAGDKLEGRAALASVPLGSGRVVLFGYRPQYRAQAWASYVALLNAVFTSAADPEPGEAGVTEVRR